MGKLGLDDSAPPYVRIASDIAGRVATGEYAPGQQLPALTALAETYGAAVGTVRSALNLLRDNGIVVTRAGSGSFVRSDVVPDAITDLLAHDSREGLAEVLTLLREINTRVKAIEARLDASAG